MRIHSTIYFGLIVLMGASALIGCQRLHTVEAGTEGVTYSTLADSVAPDPEVEALLAPYRAEVEARTSEVIGEATGPFEKGRWESPLGNLAADALLYVVQGLVEDSVELALTNNGGLRIPLPPGPITLGTMFELMPFENMLTVLMLTGVEVDTLAQQIARVGGEPIAGFSFTVQAPTRRAFDIRVAGQPLDLDARYRLVTSDYLANGGGRIPVLWKITERQDLSFLLRDAFVTYIRDFGVITPSTDGRIRAMQ